MDLIVFLSILAGLFGLVGIAEPLAQRLRLPFSVLLALMGIVVGAGAGFLLRTDITDALNPVALSILTLPISSKLFLYVFLPTLLFQVALTLDLRRMLDDWVPVLVLAVLAVVLATLVIGAALLPFAGQPLVVCLLVGAVVATTDPSAVVGIFREMGAPQRLARLIEGESLLNDAAAIALFGFFAALVLPGAAAISLDAQLARFAVLLLGGTATGFAIAGATVWLMERLRGHRLAQVSVSVALPYVTYIVSEQALEVSGVVAVVVAGMVMNFAGPSRLPPNHWAYLRETWELLAHWAGSIVFLLAALLVPRLLRGVTWGEIGLVGVVVVAAFAARAIILFGVLPLLAALRLSPPVSRPYKLVILWGGLRGAVTLALVLAVSENAALPADAQRLVAVLATGFTMFTLLVQGTTLRAVIHRVRLDRLSPLEAALQNQIVAVALQSVREEVADATKRHQLTRDIVRSEAKAFAVRLDAAVAAAEEGAEILDRDRITLGLVTLAGAEREAILEGFRAGDISPGLVERMLADAARLIERTRAGGRIEYRRTGRENIAYGRLHAFAYALHRRLHVSGPLARIAADRFEILIILRMILRDLHGFVDTKIVRIHGRRVADLMHEVLGRREEDVDRELDGLRLQYPGHADEVERRFIRKAVLRLEEREFDASRDDGLIGSDLYQLLARDVAARRRAADVRPRLDLSLQKVAMVAQFPLFATLGERRRKRLARALVTIFAEPGDVLMRKGDPADAVWFLASGAVAQTVAGHERRMGRGEMFGELALLSGQRRRRANVRAITHCTLLKLDEQRFRRLLARNPEIARIVAENARGRGIDPDLLARMLGPVAATAVAEGEEAPFTEVPPEDERTAAE